MAEIDSREARRYLLGQLDEPARSALEDRYLADPQALEAIEAEEADLVDDYVRGVLGPGERQRFEAHYLATDRHRERVRFARALLAAADNTRREAPWRTQLPYWLAAAAALALMTVLVSWSRSRGERQTARVQASPEASVSARPAAPAPTVEPPVRSTVPSSISVLLSPLVLRGDEPPAPVAVPQGTGEIDLRLSADVAEYRKLRVGISVVGGKAAWKSGELSLPAQASGAVVVRVPAERLPPEDYIVGLEGLTDDESWEEVQRYSLRIAGAPER